MEIARALPRRDSLSLMVSQYGWPIPATDCHTAGIQSVTRKIRENPDPQT